jgi:Methyltransferase domain
MSMNIHRLYSFVGRRFRDRRMKAFARTLHPTDRSTILDVGGYPGTWSHFPQNPSIVTLNLHAVDFIQTPEFPPIQTAIGDGCCLDYPDASFDIVFSNSVIEHLGAFERQKAFANAARRVGRSLWIHTPAKEFFVEPHLLAPFIHFLPVSFRRRLIRHFTPWGIVTKPSPAAVEAFLQEVRLLSFAEMEELFPDCEIRRETVLGFTKSYIAIRERAPIEKGGT